MDTKIQQKQLQEFIDFKALVSKLTEGDLLGFEQQLRSCMQTIANAVSDKLLVPASKQLFPKLRQEYGAQGFKKLTERETDIQIFTGHVVKVPSLYAKEVPSDYSGSRHLIDKCFGVIGDASPLYYSLVCLCTAVCPSYDTGNEVLMNFGLTQCVTRVRNLSMKVAEHCHGREVGLSLGQEDDLSGGRVVVEVDGGRTRTREWAEERTGKGYKKYGTPWTEPKLFTIRAVDKEGRLSKLHRPIYGVRFSDKDMLSLLEEYLSALNVGQAAEVQTVADGAPWIWNSVPALLTELGVPKERQTNTLDYYHASSYVHRLVEAMRPKLCKPSRDKKLSTYKNWLWNGESHKIVADCREIFKRPNQELAQAINYLHKHNDKTQYTDYQANNQFCGSGLVESGIRRVINLRFKNPSTFWEKENVEKLFFLRSSFLAKRWDILIQNLANSV